MEKESRKPDRCIGIAAVCAEQFEWRGLSEGGRGRRGGGVWKRAA